MNLIPTGLTRTVSRQLLKLNKNSPTILVVSGVVGFGVTAVMAAKATRNLDPVLETHQKQRFQIGSGLPSKELARVEKREIVQLYGQTSVELLKLYGPTLAVGTLSTVSVLSGHRILKGRHLATMAAYTGLLDQFTGYRDRVAQTLGTEAERDIYNGAHGEWVEDPDHKGEYKMKPKFDDAGASYLRPYFDEFNVNWTRHPSANFLFLKGVQQHMNNLLRIRGHVFLNDAYDALGMPRTKEGSVAGWLFENPNGDGYIDFGFMSGKDPMTVAFQNGAEASVRLNFNIDGVIWNLI